MRSPRARGRRALLAALLATALCACASAQAICGGEFARGFALTFDGAPTIASTRTLLLDSANPQIATLADGFTFTAFVRFDDLDPRLVAPSFVVTTRSGQRWEPFAGVSGGFQWNAVLSPSHVGLLGAGALDWHHYAWTWRRADGALVAYIDGKERAHHTVGVGSDWLADDAFIILGAHLVADNGVYDDFEHAKFNANAFMRGQVDDIGLFGAVLEPDDVRVRANASLTARLRDGLEPDLVLLYDFDDEGSGDVAINLGSAGPAYDLLLGRLPKTQDYFASRAKSTRDGEVYLLAAPIRSPAGLGGRGCAPRTPPDASAPLIAVLPAGANATIALDGYDSIEVVTPVPFDAEFGLALVRSAGSAHAGPTPVGVRVLPRARPEVMYASTELTLHEDTTSVFQLFSRHPQGARVFVRIDVLPTRGSLFERAIGQPGDRGALVNASGHIVQSADRGFVYQPAPGSSSPTGQRHDSFTYVLVDADYPQLTSGAAEVAFYVAEVNDPPVVESVRVSMLEDENGTSGIAVPLVATDAETARGVARVITGLPRHGMLYMPQADGNRTPIDRVFSAYDVEGILQQYAHEVVAVSSYWGQPPLATYAALQILGAPDCSTFGECRPDGAWVSDLSIAPPVGAAVQHSGIAARVVSASDGSPTVTIRYERLFKNVTSGSSWAFVPCGFDLAPNASRIYPGACDPALADPPPVDVPRVAIDVPSSAAWSPLRRAFDGARLIGGGAFGAASAFNHLQADFYPPYTEYIEIAIKTPVFLVDVEVFSPRGMGAIVGIKARGEGGSAEEWATLYSGEPMIELNEELTRTRTYHSWAPEVCRTPFKVKYLRLELDTTVETGVADWNYLDAVKVIGARTLSPSVLLEAAEHVVYVPNAHFHGEDSFTFSATDCLGVAFRSSVRDATARINVVSVNDAPHVSGTGATYTLGNEPVLISLTASDLDHDVGAGEVRLIVTRLPAAGTLYAGELSAEPISRAPHALAPGALRLYYAATSIDGAASIHTDSLGQRIGSDGFDLVTEDALGLQSARARVTVTVIEPAATASDQDDDGGGTNGSDQDAKLNEGALVVDAQVLIIVAVAVSVALVVLACVCVGRRARKAFQHYVELERGRKARRDEIIDQALRTTRELKFPMHVVDARTFLSLGSLVYFEQLRKQQSHVVLDSLEEIVSIMQAGKQIIFLSHQWLAFDAPDPLGVQYHVMIPAIEQVAAANGWRVDDCFVWCDCCSIPQKSKALQELAIDTLPIYSAIATAFVIIAPAAAHKQTGLTCDASTYQRRLWCRAEQLSHSLRDEGRNMWIVDHTESEARKVDAAWLDDALHVFKGDATCCQLKHDFGGVSGRPCDRELLVRPFLGLYGDVLLKKRAAQQSRVPRALGTREQLVSKLQHGGRVQPLQAGAGTGDQLLDTQFWAGQANARLSHVAERRASQSSQESGEHAGPSFANLTREQQQAFFPKNFEYVSPAGVEKRELFGDLLQGLEERIERRDADALHASHGEPREERSLLESIRTVLDEAKKDLANRAQPRSHGPISPTKRYGRSSAGSSTQGMSSQLAGESAPSSKAFTAFERGFARSGSSACGSATQALERRDHEQLISPPGGTPITGTPRASLALQGL